MRQDGVRTASLVSHGRDVGIRGASICVRMRQEGVRVASGRHHDNFASGWPQDDVKQHRAPNKWLQLLRLDRWFCVQWECWFTIGVNIRIFRYGASTLKLHIQVVVGLGPHLDVQEGIFEHVSKVINRFSFR